MIRVVVFDGDQTLWDFETARAKALDLTCQEIVRLTGAPTALVTPSRLQELWQQVSLEPVQRRFEEQRKESLRLLLVELQVGDEAMASEITEFYLSQRFAHCEVYPDVRPCLDQLRGTFRVVLLSNGNTYPDRVGMAEYFDGVFFAQDIGYQKPDERAFRLVQNTLDCQPLDIINIGDSLHHDVYGALDAGWRAMWLNRNEATLPTDGRTFSTRTHLRGLADELRGLV